MGTYDESRRGGMAWQATLGTMKQHGTRLILSSCNCPAAPYAVDLDQLLAERGPDASLWNVETPCATCGVGRFYLASPGPGTPFRPMIRR